jgi:hypothetical protein
MIDPIISTRTRILVTAEMISSPTAMQRVRSGSRLRTRACIDTIDTAAELWHVRGVAGKPGVSSVYAVHFD